MSRKFAYCAVICTDCKCYTLKNKSLSFKEHKTVLEVYLQQTHLKKYKKCSVYILFLL